MKKNKITLAIVPFIVGAIFGISIFAFLSFSRMSASPEPQVVAVSAISPSDANTIVKHFLSTATTPTVPTKGFYVDLQQLEAMNKLMKENASLAGFRLYLGRGADEAQVGIVVGVDSKGIDATMNTVYKTNSPKTGPCPPVCDQNSPITK